MWRLALCAGLFVVVLVQVWENAGLLVRIDHLGHDLGLAKQTPWLTPIALGADHIGQREPIAGVLLGAATTLARFRRTARPLLLSFAALLAVNFIVGALKLGYGRQKPHTGDTSPLEGGMMFPSGHTANVVLTWGLLAYLLIVYGGARRKQGAVVTVVVLSLLMGMVSLFLDTHWVTDIVAGWLIGAILLQLLILIDTVWPPVTDGGQQTTAYPTRLEPPIVTHELIHPTERAASVGRTTHAPVSPRAASTTTPRGYAAVRPERHRTSVH